eukprot:gene8486-17491_t
MFLFFYFFVNTTGNKVFLKTAILCIRYVGKLNYLTLDLNPTMSHISQKEIDKEVNENHNSDDETDDEIFEPEGTIYDGEYMYGVRHGHGTLAYLNGDIFEGEFKFGRKNGQGELRFADGSKQSGEYQDDQLHGTGKNEYKNGDIYEGEFKNGFKHGKGILKYANGDVYEGLFSDGRMEGNGIYRYANGRTYECEYNGDSMTGKGVLKSKNGDIYEGELKNMRAHGKGVWRYSNGDIYDGMLEDGKKHGKGIMRQAHGVMIEGEYEHDKYIGRKYEPRPCDNWCVSCHKQNAKKICGKCKKVKYCSTECQHSHWKTHKWSCKKSTTSTQGSTLDSSTSDVSKIAKPIESTMATSSSTEVISSNLSTSSKEGFDDTSLASPSVSPSKTKTQHLSPQVILSTNCAHCNKDDCSLRCSGCKTISYCSADCQKQHWKVHKMTCKSNKEKKYFPKNMPQYSKNNDPMSDDMSDKILDVNDLIKMTPMW